MALLIVSPLEPDPDEVKLPAKITFSLQLQDDEAGNQSKEHTFTLGLAATNDLSFAAIGAGGQMVKKKPFTRKISSAVRTVSFTATVHGRGDGLGGFRVSLDVPGTPGTGCLVGLR